MRQTKHQFKYAVCRLKKAKDKIETDILVNLEIICGTLQMSDMWNRFFGSSNS